jgi:hypothetical protein
MLQFIVPALFQTDEFLDLLGETRLAGLDMLLSRGRYETIPDSNLEALLCRELGIGRQQDWPVAPISLVQAGGQPGNDYWLRADPVHVRIERDQLILCEIPEPGPEEAKMLCDALSAHFGEAFSPQPIRPGAWVVRITTRPDITTTPLPQAAAQHIDPLLPAGGDSLPWRKLLNEVQMLLFNHPLNQARELRGEPVINSVWLWGGGCLPIIGEKFDRPVYCNNPDWRALAEYSGAEIRKLPDTWNPQIPDHALIILDEPHRSLRRGDFKAWLEAIQSFENDWLQPLLASGHSFRVDDPIEGNGLFWRSAYRWKFWRRAQKQVQQKFNVQAPPIESGVDPFGNRY